MNETMARITAILDAAFIGYTINRDIIRFRTRNSIAINTTDNTFVVFGGGLVIRSYTDPNGDILVGRVQHMLENPTSYLYN